MNKKILIAKSIEDELRTFTRYYRDSISSDNKRIREVIDYTLEVEGKQIRPILLLLAAKMCGEVNETTYNAAVTIELLHTATLIHDDVVDESLLRRGRPSVNAVFDNKVSVLIGDLFLSTALIKSVLTGNIGLISSISDLGRSLSIGELNQLYIAKDISFNEKDYYEVIRKKTASLLAVAMKMGALSVGADEAMVQRFFQLGEYLGICFQLRDDIFDYFGDDVGKPTGNDIRERKVTLPLIHAFENAPQKGAHLREYLSKGDALTDAQVEELIAFAKSEGGIEYTYEAIQRYVSKACELIEQLPECEQKDALLLAIDYIVERKY